LTVIDQVERASGGEPALLNMAAAARLVTFAALERRESRGGHFRTDYPSTDLVQQRSFMTLTDVAQQTNSEFPINTPHIARN
jgi:L-aspartate oxidase